MSLTLTGAGAEGLSQVVKDTGSDSEIFLCLNWPKLEVNGSLFT